MKCWWCGVEPVETFGLCVMESAQPVRQVAHWPGGDHQHSDVPPTPEQLAEQAYAMLNQRASF